MIIICYVLVMGLKYIKLKDFLFCFTFKFKAQLKADHANHACASVYKFPPQLAFAL